MPHQTVWLARKKPDALTYAWSGNGSVNHLLGETLELETGIRMRHVPYKGGAQAKAVKASGARRD